MIRQCAPPKPRTPQLGDVTLTWESHKPTSANPSIRVVTETLTPANAEIKVTWLDAENIDVAIDTDSDDAGEPPRQKRISDAL